MPPLLNHYSTVLQKQDTKEYKKREAEAMKLANEIEKSDAYKARIDLENGDNDEEDKYSAVIRPADNNNANTGR